MAKSKLIIGFDANPLINGAKSGIGTYTNRLIFELANNSPDELMLVGHGFNFLGRNNSRLSELPNSPNIEYRFTKFIPSRLFSVLRKIGITVPYELLIKTRCDMFLFTNYISYPSLRRTKVVSLIYDLGFIDVPDSISARNRVNLLREVPKTIKRSSLIITISDFSKKRIQQKYNPSAPILVEHIPPPTETLNSAVDLSSLNIPGKFFLFVGNIEPRKNLEKLIDAYMLLPKKIKQEYSLVLAGGKGWNDEGILAKIEAALSQGERMILTGYVSDSQKEQLYKNASLFVFPSIYEGFGMPIIEAFKYGVPVVASDIAVHREIAKTGAVFCDPKDQVDISNKIKDLIGDKAKQMSLVDSGNKVLKELSWEKVAEEISCELKKLAA